MLYFRRILQLFLVLFVLVLVTPLPNWQDDGSDDDRSAQTDNSGDQQSDSARLNDFLFEHPSVPDTGFEHKLCYDFSDESAQRPVSIRISVIFLPHLFILESGLMPRAPTLV